MNAIFKGTVGFVVGYLVFMVPTYVLPYFGSNSAVVGAIGAAVGRGFTPQFWLHAWCLAMLVLVTSVRAKNIRKGWLLIFPVLAGFFDLVPVLNLIPLVPTVMHLFALVLGAMGTVMVVGESESATTTVEKGFSWEPWAAGLMSLSAISGTFHFMSGLKAMGKPAQALSAPLPVTPKAESFKAPGLDSAMAQPSAAETYASAPPIQTKEATAFAAKTPKLISPKPQTKKLSGPVEMRHALEPGKVEDKPTVRYIDINN